MDFIADLGALDSKQSELDGLTTDVKTLNTEFDGSYLNSLSGTEISSLSSHLNSSLERLEKGYSNSNSWFSRYNSELTKLENDLCNVSGTGGNKAIEFKDSFPDLFTKATVPLITTAAQKEREEMRKRLGEHLVEYTHTDKFGNTAKYYVVDTKISVKDYENYVLTNKLYQNAGLLGSECMLLSQYYACDMLSGKLSSKGKMLNRQGAPACRMNEGCTSLTDDAVLKYAYDEINEGNPVVLQVTQKMTYKGWRHLVTMVGYKSTVKSYKDLTPENILVLDCVDGKVQTLAERNRKLYNQGNKYLAYGPTETFKASIA